MKPLLPQLRNTLAPGPIQGAWNIHPKSIFAKIAQDLKYEQAVQTSINSIPSPWARALLFQSVFLSDQHPNRKELIYEYIGFLAALAFAKVKELPIEAKQINLRELSKQNAYADSLYGLVPNKKDSLLINTGDNNPWESIFTFSLQGNVIGITSPATLVVPSIWLAPTLASFIPWVVEIPLNGPGRRGQSAYRYSDPKHHLGRQEQSTFASWLLNVKQNVLTTNSYGQDLANKMGMIIDDYLLEMGAPSTTGGPSFSTSIQVFGVALNPKPLDVLAQTIDPGAIKRESNIRVLERGKQHQEPLYLVDKNLVPQILNIQAHEICVSGATTLAAFQEGQSSQAGTYWTADDFFLPRMRWFRGGNLLPGSWLDTIQPESEQRTIIPPINPKVKDFFSSSDLQQAISLDKTMTPEGQGVRVSIEIEITGIDSPKRISIFHDYPICPEDELAGERPYLAIWPHLPSGNHWKKFYTIVQENKNRSTSSYAFTIEQPESQSTDSILEGDLGCVYRIWTSPTHPDILSLLDQRQNLIGILPINAPDVSVGRSGEWTIGVDFGTSFTNLHVSRSGARERLDLKTMALNITNKPENTSDNKNFFVPTSLIPEGHNPPMSTLLTIRGSSEPDSTPIYMTNSRLYNPAQDERSLHDYIISDIKWTNPKYLDAFLTTLVNLVSAHAAKNDVRKITWKASFPTAFSVSEVARYQQAWKRALNDASNVSGIKHHLGKDQSAKSAFQTESIAFAQYFADELGEQLVFTTCLDIGGGTTDISIWKDMELIHQLSIPFAGRDIFHQILKRNVNRVGDIFGLSEDKSFELLTDLKNSGDNFDAYLDSYLRLKGDNVLELLRNAGNTETIQGFRTLLALAYAGLYYYIGLVLKYLGQQQATPVYLGGNGSRFINWIDPDGQYSESSEINRLLSYVLAKAGEFDTQDTRDTVLSRYPKQEAAGGLIVEETRLKGLDLSSPDAYAGMPMVFECDTGTIRLTADQQIKLPEQVQLIKRIAIDDFTEIGNFLDVFNEGIRTSGIRDIKPLKGLGITSDNILNDIKFDLTNEVKQMLNSKRAIGEGLSQNYEPDPGFIVAHKALLRILSKQWSKNAS